MADADGEATVAERLGRLLDRGLLPAGGPAEAAERLIERLNRPARVALLGLPGCGKSAILNLLAGVVVIPETLRLPTMIVQHGAEPRMLCTLSDGRVVTVPGTDLEKVLTLSPALITLELDIPALKVISLLEVAAGPMEAEQRRAALWAGKRADILIWCTTAYLPKEQLVWEGLPDSYKDNGFLLLTKIDLLGSREAAAGMHARIEQRAGPEFRQVLPISAKQARAAAPEGLAIDRDRFRESGAAAVIATIKSRVQTARQADKDTAELILARHTDPAETTAKPKVQLKAVESHPLEAPSADSLADEAAALERVAAAAAEVLASQESAAERPVLTGRSEEALDPFPEPEPGGDEAEPTVSVEPERSEPEAPGGPADLGEDATLAAAIESAITGISKPGPSEPAQAPTFEPDPGIESVQEAQPESGEGAQRFAARLREITATAEPAPTELVPLRATWKSRNNSALSIPIEPKPEPNRNPTPRLRPVDSGATSRPAGREPVAPVDASEPPSAPDSVGGPPVAAPPVVADTREPRPTSVFGARPRSEPLTGVAQEAESEDVPPVSAGGNAAPSENDVPLPPEAMTSADMPSRANPEAEERRLALSERLGRSTGTAAPESIDAAVVHRVPRGLPQSPLAARPSAVHQARSDQSSVERRERPRIAPRAVEEVRPPSPQKVGIVAEDRALVAQTVELIQMRSVDLSDQIDPDDKAPVDMIIDHTRETVDQILGLLSRSGSAEIRRISTNIGEIQDLITLMQLEKGRAPADDALTLLLQLRRELETLHSI